MHLSRVVCGEGRGENHSEADEVLVDIEWLRFGTCLTLKGFHAKHIRTFQCKESVENFFDKFVTNPSPRLCRLSR